jgi:outer membrane protein OmpA-like peptidoglycan-associated protein
MSFNILEAVKGHLTPDLISKATKFLGENESGVAKAMSGILPVVLSGMVSKASSGGAGASEVFNAAKQTHSSGFLGGLGNLFGDSGGMLGKGLDLVKGLFGHKLDGIINTISSFAGVKSSSVSSLLSMAAPMAAGTLGKHAVENNLDAGGLASMLSSQKSSIMNMLPGGLSGIAGMLGIGKASDAVSSLASGTRERVTTNYSDDTRASGGGMGWLKWLLPLLLAGGLGWWFLLGGKNSCNKTTPAATSDTTVTVPGIDTAATLIAPPITGAESLKVKLPDGTELDAFKGGIEEKLVGFLNTEWMKLGEDSLKKIWFDFDNLNFKTGKSEITPESQQQVNNMIAILKAYPNAKLKIGGYTDKVGNEEINKKLSGERANAVKASLDKAGVGKQVLGAEGYGSQFAKYPADAPESDRVKDRHVSVSVRG